MKRNLLAFFMFGLFALMGRPASAQYVLKEADVQFELFNYAKAVDLYEVAYKKNPTLHAAEQLAVCYSLMNNYQQAESWYAKVVEMPKSAPVNIYSYALALQNNSKYAEAKSQFLKYFSLDKEFSLKKQNIILSSCDSAVLWMRSPTKVAITNEKGLNSAQSDWGSVKYMDEMVFTSDRKDSIGKSATGGRPFLKFDGSKKPNRNIYGSTGNGYLHLYMKKGTDSVKLFPLNTGTNYHVGAASFTADGKEMYFTLTKIDDELSFSKNSILKSKLATVNVEIFSSKKDTSGNWGEAVPFAYNKVNEYSVGDPFISSDGKTLYFASNMPGGKGGTDIYASLKTDAGDWGTPINMESLNTDGNERNPFKGIDDTFYFSSDGRVGMGGLDIFSSKSNGSIMSVPKNLGYPTNSPKDDFAFTSYAPKTGYFSSNRNNGAGQDDIYSFVDSEVIVFKLIGTAFNKVSKAPLGNTLVTLKNLKGTQLKAVTQADGKFEFGLDESSDYTLLGSRDNYLNDVASLTTRGLVSSSTLTRDLFLDSIVINKVIKIENIYYDFDKSNIRPDAAEELDKLVMVLTDNPTILIELGSHTDSRGNDQYNQWLSQKRANSAVQYIIDKGISKNRITAKGYGESMPVNRCTNGVKCSEADFQLNRRTEFKIVKQ
ncbi:flagellar motor protein MotB [Pedobacter changchengzhani]|uniref:Flagellar motor protein MotB n=1 Tax=Pedobacter changchengzhani TaxID=2529274 RepID=A0A4R5MH43_9SPHI|nr:OmpA family protein [Pedobacter changchengzhani]TDG34781.1 flagellar motor protein MotB [Pedobacter changchengzhani]